MRRGALVAVALAMAAPRIAAAHPLDIGYVRIDTRPAADGAELVDVSLDVAVTLGESLATGVPTTDRGACAWLGAPQAELRDTTRTLTRTARCPAGSLQLHLELPFVTAQSPTFQLLAHVHGFAGDHVAVVDRLHPALEVAAASSTHTGFATFVLTGVRHIGAAPSEWHDARRGWHLPAGIDHIAFLLALLLGGGTLLQLAAIATGFTLGHSLTLALAASGLVRPPASLIEPLIALTIVAAALEAYSGRLSRHRPKIAAAFGLVHGFAFASALADLDLTSTGLAAPLFGFNLGVELGQLALIALLAPPILALHARTPRTARLVTRAAAALIALAGAYWFLTRL